MVVFLYMASNGIPAIFANSNITSESLPPEYDNSIGPSCGMDCNNLIANSIFLFKSILKQNPRYLGLNSPNNGNSLTPFGVSYILSHRLRSMLYVAANITIRFYSATIMKDFLSAVSVLLCPIRGYRLQLMTIQGILTCHSACLTYESVQTNQTHL